MPFPCAKADDSGNWSFDYTDTTLADGSYTLTAKATDNASNVRAPSTSFGITLDTVAPTVTVDLLGTADTSPPLTGATNDANAVISVTVKGNTYSAANNGDGTWTLPGNTISPPFSDQVNSSHDVTVTATDNAGNTGTGINYIRVILPIPYNCVRMDCSECNKEKGFADTNCVERIGFNTTYFPKIIDLYIPYRIATKHAGRARSRVHGSAAYSTSCQERFENATIFGKKSVCTFLDRDGSGYTNYLMVTVGLDADVLRGGGLDADVHRGGKHFTVSVKPVTNYDPSTITTKTPTTS